MRLDPLYLPQVMTELGIKGTTAMVYASRDRKITTVLALLPGLNKLLRFP